MTPRVTRSTRYTTCFVRRSSVMPKMSCLGAIQEASDEMHGVSDGIEAGEHKAQVRIDFHFDILAPRVPNDCWLGAES
jgi:hypothetical protein